MPTSTPAPTTASPPQTRYVSAVRLRAESGQTTAEYALVLLGVAAIAMLLLSWARSTGTITRLFDAVLESIIGLVP